MKSLLLIATLLLCSCTGSRKSAPTPSSEMSHATLLHIEHSDSFTLATIASPWVEGKALARYVVVPADSALPSRLPEGILLRTPLRRTIAFSTIHAALLQELGVSTALLGVCDAQYIVDDTLKKALADGRLANFGNSMQPNIEAIIASQSDALLVSPIENAGYGLIERIGIPLIVCPDYMESSALGRAEWLRFFGLLYHCEATADSLFHTVVADYERLKLLAASSDGRPTVLCDLREGAAWYMPGGKSTWAELFRDAGVNYALSDNDASGSVALNFERVLTTMANADFWMIKYGRSAELSYESLAADYSPYRHFRPWRERKIFGCNTFVVPYYEKAPFRPDLLLHDIIKMAHPGLLADEDFHFYSPLRQ